MGILQLVDAIVQQETAGLPIALERRSLVPCEAIYCDVGLRRTDPRYCVSYKYIRTSVLVHTVVLAS